MLIAQGGVSPAPTWVVVLCIAARHCGCAFSHVSQGGGKPGHAREYPAPKGSHELSCGSNKDGCVDCGCTFFRCIAGQGRAQPLRGLLCFVGPQGIAAVRVSVGRRAGASPAPTWVVALCGAARHCCFTVFCGPQGRGEPSPCVGCRPRHRRATRPNKR